MKVQTRDITILLQRQRTLLDSTKNLSQGRKANSLVIKYCPSRNHTFFYKNALHRVSTDSSEIHSAGVNFVLPIDRPSGHHGDTSRTIPCGISKKKETVYRSVS